MKSFLYLWLFITVSFYSLSVDNLRAFDIRALSLGGQGVTQSTLFNPALLTLSTSKQIYVGYLNQYGLKELGTIGLGFTFPNSILPAGFHLSSFGYDAYRTTMFRLSIGKSLNEQWKIGVAFQAAFLQTELMEEAPKQFSTDIGVLYLPVENLLIGLLIMNFPTFSVHKQSNDSQSIMDYTAQIGFQWKVINNLLMIGTLENNKAHLLIGNIGIEYTLFDNFFIRTGIQTAPLLPSFGIGYRLSAFTCHVATQIHPLLGASLGIGLSYSF